jgi:hypothetical protein
VEAASGRRRKGQRLLYWFRTPPGVRVGRAPIDQEAIRLLEQHNPDVQFDWTRILKDPPPDPQARRERDPRERDRRERRDARPRPRPSESAAMPARHGAMQPPTDAARSTGTGVADLSASAANYKEEEHSAAGATDDTDRDISATDDTDDRDRETPATDYAERDTSATDTETDQTDARVAAMDGGPSEDAGDTGLAFSATGESRTPGVDAVTPAFLEPDEAPVFTDADRASASYVRLGAEGLGRLRARYAEVLTRIGEKPMDESAREELKLQAERLNPDGWVTTDEVSAALEQYETVFESLRSVVGRHPRRRRRR